MAKGLFPTGNQGKQRVHELGSAGQGEWRPVSWNRSKERTVLDRYVPLAPTLSVLLLSGAIALIVAGRHIRANNDRAALREYDAIELGYQAGLRAAH